MTINYYTATTFINPKISYGFFTRKDGFSFNNYTSLNCSYSSGDQYIAVKKNIEQAQRKLHLEIKNLKLINQIHSNKVIIINEKNFKKKFEADGMITQDKNISIAVLTADCCPIFLFDEEASFISCLHAGWKGCYINIVENALKKIKHIQPSTKKINAIIGPCLNKINFEVNNDLKEKFIKKVSSYENFFVAKKQNNKFLFDMQGLIKFQLLKNDITNTESIELDTYSNKELFFSHRRSTHDNKIPTGRMINIIGFNK
jgi:hypothetical protein